MSNDERKVWIRTVPDLEGTYRVVLEIDEDTSHPLDAGDAMIYARAVLSTVARAEHDAAVIRQMSKVGEDRRMAAELVSSIRADRPPIAWPTPLVLVPGVSSTSGDAFLTVVIKGAPVGQWTPDDARRHVLGVLGAVEVADLDGAYLRALLALGVDRARAEIVVDDLSHHRKDGH